MSLPVLLMQARHAVSSVNELVACAELEMGTRDTLRARLSLALPDLHWGEGEMFKYHGSLTRDRQRFFFDIAREGPPRAYTPDVFKAKTGVVFQHVYERYGRAA